LCDGCDRIDDVTAADDGRGQFCPECLPIANGDREFDDPIEVD
jgi:hypothetical protein